MKKFFKILISLIIIIVVAAFAVLYVIPIFESAKAGKDPQPAWMKDIPDDTLISNIMIPGTHDSASAHAMLPFFSRCQYFSMGQQLADGYRYLDIRLGEKNGELVFYHGFCPCQTGPWPWSGVLKLNDEIKTIYSFLKDNPTETVIFVVKMEQGSDIAGFQKLLHECIDEYPDYWYLSDTLPKLGDCRGKIVLMYRYWDELHLGSSAGIYINWNDQGERANGSPKNIELEGQRTFELYVQDRYKYDDEDKWAAFTQSFEYVRGQSFDDSGPRSNINLDFLSTNGSAAYGHPYSHAKVLNPRLLSVDFTKLVRPGQKHWIITDFSTAEIAEHIYKENFR